VCYYEDIELPYYVNNKYLKEITRYFNYFWFLAEMNGNIGMLLREDPLREDGNISL